VLERVAVEAIEAVFGTEPHESLFVLGDRQDGLLGQAVVESETLETHGHRAVRLAAADANEDHQQECL